MKMTDVAGCLRSSKATVAMAVSAKVFSGMLWMRVDVAVFDKPGADFALGVAAIEDAGESQYYGMAVIIQGIQAVQDEDVVNPCTGGGRSLVKGQVGAGVLRPVHWISRARLDVVLHREVTFGDVNEADQTRAELMMSSQSQTAQSRSPQRR